MKRLLKVCAATMLCGGLVAGCGGGGGGGGGGSSSGVFVDAIPPSVVYTTPVHNEAGVGTNTKITVTFSEAVDPATVTKDTFQLVNTTSSPGTPVTLNANDVTYDENNRIATITPPLPASLEGNKQYTVTVKPGVKDRAGNTMTTPYDWAFTTGAGADGTVPALLSKAPADGAIGVGTNTVVAMSFNKPMDISTFSSAFSLKTGSTTITGTFSLIGQVVVFTPDTNTPIIPGGTYTATLTTDAEDLMGNHLVAGETWSFTTGSTDAQAPRRTAYSPIDGERNVPTNSPISVTFDEAIYPFLFGTIDGKVTKVEIDYATNTVTMTPTDGLKADTRYDTRIMASDLARNRSIIYAWSFWTAP